MKYIFFFFCLRNIELRWQQIDITTLNNVHIFDSKLVKMYSHVVEFLSAVFARFYVRSTLSIVVRQCLKSLKVKSEA